MSMSHLRQVVDLYDHPGKSNSMDLLLRTAQSVLDAPRIWWCEVYWEAWFGPRTACVYSPTQHSKCRWVRLVDDPQEEGEE